MDVFVLDACSLIAYLRKEEGYEKVILILNKANVYKAKIIMHAASVAEVYYDFWRASDEITADNIISDLQVLPVEIINTITMQMIQEIGYFKTIYKISFADSIVLAAAKLNDAKVVTSDHNEFHLIEKSGDVIFEWVR